MNHDLIKEQVDTTVQALGRPAIDSPLQSNTIFVKDTERVVIDASLAFFNQCTASKSAPLSFELAGPRKKIYFDPSKTKCGIVTCGGLCPGINDVIRGIVLELYYAYHVKNIYGILYGLQGFIPAFKHALMELNPAVVEQIHELGGTILGSSRGAQDVSEMVDAVERLNMNIVFFIGGDGTLKAASAVAREALRRGFKCAVIAVPKTIDNDIYFVSKTFGFDTAVEEARKVITCAHVEAKGAPNGIGLVKVMGRDSGFIAANAALASRDVNFVLVPEEDFDLDGPKGILSMLEARIKARGHAVIVVAEGAGQKYFKDLPEEKDASGNVRKYDIGPFLKEHIEQHFQLKKIPINFKYLDPSYIIRSVTANASDSIFCGFLAQMAVHAGLSGKTDMLIGLWNNVYVNIPNEVCLQGRKKIDTNGPLWMSVRESTGQPSMSHKESANVEGVNVKK